MLSEKTEPVELSSSCVVFSPARNSDVKYHHAYQHGQKSKMSVEVSWFGHIFKALF